MAFYKNSGIIFGMKDVVSQSEQVKNDLSPMLLARESGLSFSVAQIAVVFASFIAVFLSVLIGGEGYASTQWFRYLSFLVPQAGLLIAAAVYFFRSKDKVKRVVNGCKWQYFLIAIVMQFGLLCLSELNVYFVELLRLMGYQPSSISLPDLSGWNILPALIVIALLPALFEELLFRGILVGGIRRAGWGTVASVLLSGAMFSLFHGNPQQTIYQFVCGVCYALVAWRSGSVLPTVLAHLCNNTLVLVLTRFGLSEFPSAVKLPLYICSAIALVAVMVWLCVFDKANNKRGKTVHGSHFFLYAAAGILVALISWGSTFIAGFTNG